ncbi:hypothetical protein JRI60_19325 [Archangium violaceum]|uniref:type VI secretion system protein IglI family protein n=1 Tax=Archangium violaceum TaxID=83451 RepID=UPI0019509459|nr:type VI secretion system protein IglI family protein [Archangium violaceum]QRO01029.1 hypothetical protein JRI60_19325 [Archangium violaceum]
MAELLESLAALERTLKAAPGPMSTLTPEQVETRVDRVIAQMARGAYDEAARASETLLRDGIRDVRLVTPYVFGTFLAQGPRSLPALFSALHQVYTRGWEQLGPDDNKPTLADSGLLWLFKTLHKHLEFHGRTQDDVWRRWCESCSQSHVQEALQHASKLVEVLEQRTPGGGGLTRLLQVTGWLTEQRELFPETNANPVQARAVEQAKALVKEEKAPVVERRKEEPPAEPEEEATHEDTSKELEDEEQEDEEEEEEDEEEFHLEAPRALRTRSPPPLAQGHSPALEQLLHKLAAFDTLVERQDFSRASMIATDVLHVIDHFDPLVYLPSLFSRFLAGLSAHGERLEPRMQGSRSLSERALERLYRTDLQAFLSAASGAEDES